MPPVDDDNNNSNDDAAEHVIMVHCHCRQCRHLLLVVSHPAATTKAEWEWLATRNDCDRDHDKKQPEQQEPTTMTIN